MTKKKTLKEKKIATGNVPLESEQDSVYALFGYKTSPYKHTDQREYVKYIQALSLFELQRHAIDVGIVPSSAGRGVLERKLETAFAQKKYVHVNKKIESAPSNLSPEDEADLDRLFSRTRQ